jgi:SAM-dependent methyltransferase
VTSWAERAADAGWLPVGDGIAVAPLGTPPPEYPARDVAEQFGTGAWAFTPEVADVFPEHVRASVPFYDVIQDLVAELSDWLVPAGGLVADLGAATGYFTVRLARAAPKGRVYAVDIEESMLAFIAKRAAEEGLANVEPIHATPDDPALSAKLDRVLICDTYHHLGNRVAYFTRLAATLAPGARVMIVDFARDRGGPGPPDEHRIAEADVVSELGEAGYTLLRAERELLPYQYLLVFERKP